MRIYIHFIHDIRSVFTLISFRPHIFRCHSTQHHVYRTNVLHAYELSFCLIVDTFNVANCHNCLQTVCVVACRQPYHRCDSCVGARNANAPKINHISQHSHSNWMMKPDGDDCDSICFWIEKWNLSWEWCVVYASVAVVIITFITKLARRLCSTLSMYSTERRSHDNNNELRITKIIRVIPLFTQQWCTATE